MNLNPLRLNLQFFADENDTSNTEETNTDLTENDVKQDEATPKIEMTQEQLDKLIKERIARDRKKREDEAEKQRLEEQGEYKSLLEKARQEIDGLKAEKAKRELDIAIRTSLASKGLNNDEVERYSKYVEKLVTDEGEIESAVTSVYNDFIAARHESQVDPSAGFGVQKPREQKSEKDYGKELYERLKRK